MKSKKAELSQDNSIVTFPSLDGLLITAKIYNPTEMFGMESRGPGIVLCHQARFSRGEWNEIAYFLTSLGYSCLAIDQRSGGEVNGVKNETTERAKKEGKPTSYLDAEQDIIAAVNYAKQLWGAEVILVGSSYSASLALKVGMQNANVKAVAAFSPGEYFENKFNLGETIIGLNKPCFLTGSKKEIPEVKKLSDIIAAGKATLFSPTVEGLHGSKAMWTGNEGAKEYKAAFLTFIEEND